MSASATSCKDQSESAPSTRRPAVPPLKMETGYAEKLPPASTENVRSAWIRAVGKLRYQDGDNWLPLPSWMHFFVTAGALAAGFSEPNLRPVLVVTVPSRSFCSSFAALGSMF